MLLASASCSIRTTVRCLMLSHGWHVAFQLVHVVECNDMLNSLCSDVLCCVLNLGLSCSDGWQIYIGYTEAPDSVNLLPAYKFTLFHIHVQLLCWFGKQQDVLAAGSMEPAVSL